MANNYLITGYWGEPHVTAENDRGINAAIFGAGRFVLPVGQQFKAEYIGNNTVRLYDGKLLDNGAAAGIPAGKYIDLLIPEAGQGMKRNDIIAFQYSQDSSTLIESGTFVVIQGSETSGTAADPTLTQEDLLTDEAAFDQMALWRIPVSGATISAPVQLFTVSKNLQSEVTPEDGSVTSVKLADDVHEILNGKIEFVKVWDNASPSSSFAAQTIALDLEEYTHILVEFVSGAPSYIIAKGTSGTVPRINVTSTSANDTVIELFRRPISFDDTAVTFGECYNSMYTTITGKFSATSVIGTAIKPLKIYGIRGIN